MPGGVFRFGRLTIVFSGMKPCTSLLSQSSTGTLPGLEDLGLELLTAEDRRQRGHTGAGLERDEARLAVALELLGMGIGKERIAQLVGCSVSTVVRIASSHGEDVVRSKKDMAGIARAGAARLFRRIAEHADEIPLGQAAVSAGILCDKADQLDGTAPAVVLVAPSLSHATINAWIDSLPVAQPVCTGGNVEQKAGALGLAVGESGMIEATPMAPQSGHAGQANEGCE